jgi:hypothetical protein
VPEINGLCRFSATAWQVLAAHRQYHCQIVVISTLARELQFYRHIGPFDGTGDVAPFARIGDQ